MRGLLLLALLLVTNSPLLSLPAFADMMQAVWSPSAQVEADECSFGPCPLDPDGAARIQNVAMFDPEFVHVDKGTPAYTPIGLIENRDAGYYGTAFLISPCYILTNLHLIVDENSNEKSHFSFYIGASDKSDFRSEIDAQVVERGNGRGTSEDFAVLRLNQCVGDKYGFVKILNWDMKMISKIYENHVAIKMAGYPGTESWNEISLDEDCVISGMHNFDATAFAHDCRSVQQSSGSPIFIEKLTTNQIYVFAMHSGATPAPNISSGDAQLYGTAMAKDPQYFNRAVPMYAIYERIKKYLPEDADAK